METEQIEVGGIIEVQFNAPCTLQINAVVESIEGGMILCKLGKAASMKIDAYTALNNGGLWYREEDSTFVLEL